jgi:hypothetical protein
MRTLVKDGFGCALIREGTLLEDDLTTRPILGVDWTVDTAVVYHSQRHPKTVPILVRKLKRNIQKEVNRSNASQIVRTTNGLGKRPSQSAQKSPVQLSFYNEIPDSRQDNAG